MPAFLLPDLGEGLTEAEIVTWHVQAGDTVTVDQPIVEVETAKAVVEVPVPFAGRVTALHGQPGDVVAVGDPLVTVDTADRFAEPGVITSPAGPDQAGASGNVLIGYGTSSGRRRRHRATRSSAAIPAPGSPAAATATTGGHSVPPPVRNGRLPVASPLIRQLARNAGVDLTTIRGSGPGGLITRADVDVAINARQAGPAAVPEAAPAVLPGAGSAGVTRIPIRGLRKSVADKLSRSRREIPEATVWVDVDATEMLSLRAALNADESAPKISLLALLSRFTILALRRYPELNARIEGDEIVLSPARAPGLCRPDRSRAHGARRTRCPGAYPGAAFCGRRRTNPARQGGHARSRRPDGRHVHGQQLRRVRRGRLGRHHQSPRGGDPGHRPDHPTPLGRRRPGRAPRR